MGKPYSVDLRLAVVRSVESGYTREEAAELHGVSLSSVGRFLGLWRSKGDLRAAKFGGYKEYALKPHAERLTHWIAEQPDITLSELRHRLAGRKVKVSIAAIFRFLRHLKLTLRKSPARGLNGTAPTWLRRAEPGDESSGDLIHGSWSSSTRPLSRPTWCAATAGRREDSGWSAKYRLAPGRP